MKRMLTGLLVLAVCITVVTGCKKDEKASASGAVVVNFYAHSDNEAMIKELVERFNAKNQGSIEVVQHIIANDDYDDKVKVLVAGTTGEMDALWIRTPAQIQQYIANNALMDLTPLAVETQLDLSPIKNSSLKGAMDGAGKFILGTLKVGIVITIVNILGGILIGIILRGEPMIEAIKTYISLAFGAYLLFQFPTILASYSVFIIACRETMN
jgi:hypothetical protein